VAARRLRTRAAAVARCMSRSAVGAIFATCAWCSTAAGLAHGTRRSSQSAHGAATQTDTPWPSDIVTPATPGRAPPQRAGVQRAARCVAREATRTQTTGVVPQLACCARVSRRGVIPVRARRRTRKKIFRKNRARQFQLGSGVLLMLLRERRVPPALDT